MADIITDTINEGINPDDQQLITEMPPTPVINNEQNILPDAGFEVPRPEDLASSVSVPSVQPPPRVVEEPPIPEFSDLANFTPRPLFTGDSRDQLLRSRRYIMPEPQLNQVETVLTPFMDAEHNQITGERETGFARFRQILGRVFGWEEVDPNAPQIGLLGNNFGDFNLELPGIGARVGPSRLLYMLGLLPNVGMGAAADISRDLGSRFTSSSFPELLRGVRTLDIDLINEANRGLREDILLNVPGSRFFAPELFQERERQRQEFYDITEDGNHMPYVVRALSGQDLAFTNFRDDIDGDFNPFGILGNYEDFGREGRWRELPRVLLGMTLDVVLDPVTGIFLDNIDDISNMLRRSQANRIDLAPPIPEQRLLPASPVPGALDTFQPLTLRNNIPTVTAEIVDDIPVYIPRQLQNVPGEIIDAEIIETIRPALQPSDIVRRLPASSQDLNITPRTADELANIANLYNNVFPNGVSINSIDRIISALPNNALRDYLELNTRRLGNTPRMNLLPSDVTNISPSALIRSLDRPILNYTRESARQLRRIMDTPEIYGEVSGARLQELFNQADEVVTPRTSTLRESLQATDRRVADQLDQFTQTSEELEGTLDEVSGILSNEIDRVDEVIEANEEAASQIRNELGITDDTITNEELVRLLDEGDEDFVTLPIRDDLDEARRMAEEAFPTATLVPFNDRSALGAVADVLPTLRVEREVGNIVFESGDLLATLTRGDLQRPNRYTFDFEYQSRMASNYADDIPFRQLKEFSRWWRGLRPQLDEALDEVIIYNHPAGGNLYERMMKWRVYERYGFHPIRLEDFENIADIQDITNVRQIPTAANLRDFELGAEDALQNFDPDQFVSVYINGLSIPIVDEAGSVVGTTNPVARQVQDIVEPLVSANPDAYDEIAQITPDVIRPIEPSQNTLFAIDNYQIDFRTLEDSFDMVRTLESQYDELNHLTFDDYDDLAIFISDQEQVIDVLEEIGDVDADAIITVYNELVANPTSRNAARYIEQVKYRIGNQLEDAYNEALDAYTTFERSRQSLENLTTTNNRQAIERATLELQVRVDDISQQLGQGNRGACF